MKKGQVSLMAILSIAVAVLVPSISGYLYQSRRTDDKVQAVDIKVGAVSERTAKLETAVEIIQKDNAATRQDIKDFLKELRKF